MGSLYPLSHARHNNQAIQAIGGLHPSTERGQPRTAIFSVYTRSQPRTAIFSVYTRSQPRTAIFSVLSRWLAEEGMVMHLTATAPPRQRPRKTVPNCTITWDGPGPSRAVSRQGYRLWR